MRVTAVVVSHAGSTYLPRTLAAIQAQTRMPDRVPLLIISGPVCVGKTSAAEEVSNILDEQE